MNTLRAVLLLLFILGYLVNFFVKIPWLPELRATLALGFFACSVWLIKPLNRLMCLALTLIGAVLLVSHEAAAAAWIRAVIENSGLISLLLTVPLFGLILQYSSYEDAIKALASRHINSSFGYYAAVVTIVNVLGTFLSMAAIPLCYQMIKSIAADYDDTLTARALARGFCANLLWSPNLIAVAVALQYIRLSWYEVAPVGIFLSAVVYLLALGLGRWGLPPVSRSRQFVTPTAFTPEHRRRLTLLGVQIVLVLGAVLILDYAIGKNVLVAVSLVAFTVPFLIAVCTGKLTVYRRGMQNYFRIMLPSMADMFMLFTCVGFFGFALGSTEFGRLLLSRLLALYAAFPAIAPFLIIWTIGILAVLGVHPIITISSLGICLSGVNIGLTDVQLAISLMMGYILYSLTSPFSSMTLLLSGLLGKNVFAVSIKINLGYALLISLVVTGLLQFVG